MSDSWFTVNRIGLRKIVQHRPALSAIAELVSNAWDEASANVVVTIDPTNVRGQFRFKVVDDNPTGFVEIEHAFTLFAESSKKDIPEKRGRFNLGEKLVLALCIEAEIVTTTAHVRFLSNGKRTMGRKRTVTGSEVSGIFRLTREQIAELDATVDTLLPPMGILTTYNGRAIASRSPLVSFEVVLPTIVADEEGVLRERKRKTQVDLYEPLPGEEATLYELGIPVVTTGDRFHVDIRQKVPLNAERDNVKAAYLKRVRTAVLNATFTRLSTEDVASAWVKEALSDPEVAQDAVRTIVRSLYGENVVTADPGDQEANARAAAAGMRVLWSGAFSKDQWVNVREAQVAPSTGKVFPTFHPLSGGPDSPVVPTVDPSAYTIGMYYVTGLAQMLAQRLLGIEISTTIVRSHEKFGACYSPGQLILNAKRLRPEFFDPSAGWTGLHRARVLSLLLHELAHHLAVNHLSDEYYEALSSLGGKLAVLALEEPTIFETHSV